MANTQLENLMNAKEKYAGLETIAGLHMIAAAPFESAVLSILYADKIVSTNSPIYAALATCALVSAPFVISYAAKVLAEYNLKKINLGLNTNYGN